MLLLNFPHYWLTVTTCPSAFQLPRGSCCCLLSVLPVFVGLCLFFFISCFVVFVGFPEGSKLDRIVCFKTHLSMSFFSGNRLKLPGFLPVQK